MAVQSNSESEYRQMQAGVEALTEGFALFNDSDELVFCNSAFKYRYSDLAIFLEPGASWPMFLAEAKRKRLASELIQLDAHLTSGLDAPLTLDACNRGERWHRMSIHPASDGGFVITDADITDQHQAHEVIEHADHVLRGILDTCASRIVLCRLTDGVILYCTPAWGETFGFGQQIQTVFADRINYADLLTDILATDRIDDRELDMLRCDRETFPARLSARTIEYQDEMAIVLSAEDLTMLHELAARRETAFQNEKLNALGQLLTGVAHELNNPLSVVVGHAMMLKEEVTDPDALDGIGKISSSAERCAKIVKTFLAMARQKPAQTTHTNLNELIELALEIASYGLRQNGIDIQLHLDSNVPAIQVDEDQVTQVLINLMINAEQALTDLKVEPRLKITTAFDKVNGRVLATISDNGPGVPKALRTRIFEPFFTTKAVGEGTGVGLALSHRIISSHGGQLESVEGEIGGATFVVSLPSVAYLSQTNEVQASARTGITLQILLVEDESDVADVINSMLTKLGANVVLAKNAEQALQILDVNSTFDLILSDLRMPGMGGLLLLVEIEKKWPNLSDRFVFITGDAMSDDVLEIRRRSTHQLLEKPVSPQELQSLLLSTLNKEKRIESEAKR